MQTDCHESRMPDTATHTDFLALRLCRHQYSGSLEDCIGIGLCHHTRHDPGHEDPDQVTG